MIMFGFFCPILIPLTYSAVLFNAVVLLIEKEYFGRKIAPPDISSTINLFYWSLFILQMLTLFFWMSNNFADPFPTDIPILLGNIFFITCIIIWLQQKNNWCKTQGGLFLTTHKRYTKYWTILLMLQNGLQINYFLSC